MELWIILLYIYPRCTHVTFFKLDCKCEMSTFKAKYLKKPRNCDSCQTSFKGKKKVKRCVQCRHVYYCNRMCQINDWNQHKNLCFALLKRNTDIQIKANSYEMIIQRNNDLEMIYKCMNKKTKKILFDSKIWNKCYGFRPETTHDMSILQSFQEWYPTVESFPNDTCNTVGILIINPINIEFEIKLDPFNLVENNKVKLMDIISQYIRIFYGMNTKIFDASEHKNNDIQSLMVNILEQNEELICLHGIGINIEPINIENHNINVLSLKENETLRTYLKLITQQIGYLFGFNYCNGFDCLMNDSNALQLCPICLHKLYIFRMKCVDPNYIKKFSQFYMDQMLYKMDKIKENNTAYALSKMTLTRMKNQMKTIKMNKQEPLNLLSRFLKLIKFYDKFSMNNEKMNCIHIRSIILKP